MLQSCAATVPINPADIKPVNKVRNSPIPVPHPHWKPKPPERYAQNTPRKTVSPGPVPQEVTVRKGDTVYAISRRSGVQVRNLIILNDLKSPFLLKPGQRLALPTKRVHRVRRGDTSYSIAQRYGVKVSELVRLNRIRAPYVLKIGQSLTLPATSMAVPVPRMKQTASKRVTLYPPERTGKYFSWPLTGQVVSRFGPKEGGMHNDGINITARAGAPVFASEDGVVAYASNQLSGYGNMILIKHAGGWVTAYAHNASLKVAKGDRVTRGQQIASVGSTGGVKKPQLHFELRKGRRALNPLRYLKGKAAVKAGSN